MEIGDRCGRDMIVRLGLRRVVDDFTHFGTILLSIRLPTKVYRYRGTPRHKSPIGT